MTDQHPHHHPFQVHELPGHFLILRPVTEAEIVAMAKHLIAQQFIRGQALPLQKRWLSISSYCVRYVLSRVTTLRPVEKY
ncbi:hypothetical protein [Methylomonas sp. 11b]|uniref:hypothetical protein n=1 Tax=Methylomonas sp. 11b TaxID=1168169 RepID=UPI00047A2C8E|nr:hypothetical protein [Methylomonas sp. 11b]